MRFYFVGIPVKRKLVQFKEKFSNDFISKFSNDFISKYYNNYL